MFREKPEIGQQARVVLRSFVVFELDGLGVEPVDEEAEDGGGDVVHFHGLGSGFDKIATEYIEEVGGMMAYEGLVDDEGRFLVVFVDMNGDKGLGFSREELVGGEIT